MNNAAQSPEKIRVIVADDHSVVRQGLRMFLLVQPDMELVGEAQNGRDLIKAVRGAARGEPQLHPDAARMLMGLATRPPPAPEHAAILTDRERDVIALVAEGKSNKEIARELSISETTVKGHVANILGKLELTDRTQAAVYAVRNGLAREVRSSS
ncbi:MAG: response regulator transcription factor [Thermomicrobia bacterium]|nr:response regulator transcription factor [Thermomicrobia bacterium]